MDFSLDEDRRLLGETLSRFLADRYPIATRHAASSSEDHFSRETWAAMAELGVIGALLPESAGGFGGTGDDLSVVFEALGRHLVVEPFLPTLLAGTLLAGADGQGALLEEAIAGTRILAFAHGEPEGRYDPAHVATRAEQAGEGWRLTGHKAVVLAGDAADTLVVSARTAGGVSDEAGLSLFVVDPAGPGVTRRPYATVDGYGAAEIALEGAPATLLDTAGEAWPAIEAALARACLALCAESLGAMTRATELTVEYSHTRKQFGVPIGRFQVLQHRMADMLIEIEQMRSAVIGAAGRLDGSRQERERAVSAAKNLAGRAGRLIAEEAIQIHGGMGMTWEYAVGHYAKRIVMIDHLFGDADHHMERFIAFPA